MRVELRVQDWRRELRSKDLLNRGAALEQAFTDARLEEAFAKRVSANVIQRISVAFEQSMAKAATISFLRRQAD